MYLQVSTEKGLIDAVIRLIRYHNITNTKEYVQKFAKCPTLPRPSQIKDLQILLDIVNQPYLSCD